MPPGAKAVRKIEKVRGLASPLSNGVKLDMLLGNANVKYDPDLHITNKNRPVSIGVIALALTSVKEGETMFDLKNRW